MTEASQRCPDDQVDVGSAGGGDEKRSTNLAFHKASSIIASVEDLREAKLEILPYDAKMLYKTTGWAPWIANHFHFQIFSVGVFAFNAIWIAIDTDFNNLSGAHPIFLIAEYSFLVFFSFEWLIRLFSYKRMQDCLRHFWFVFDTVLVFILILHIAVMTVLMTTGVVTRGEADDSGAVSLRIVNILSLVRLSQLLARILRMMPGLMFLVKCMVAAWRSVGFTFLLLAGINYFFAVYFTQMTDGSSIGDDHFRTILLSMYTLLLRGTCMVEIVAIMDDIKEEGTFLFFVFLFFVLLTAWVLVNFFVAVLCEIVSVIAEAERWDTRLQFVQSRVRTVMEEKGFRTDEISRGHLENLLRNRDVVQILNEVGVHAEEVFEMLDSFWESGAVNERDCVSFNRCMDLALQLRGTNVATVKDLMCQRRYLNKIQYKLDKRLDEMEKNIVSRAELGRRTPRRNSRDDRDDCMGKGKPVISETKPSCSEELQEVVRYKLRELEGLFFCQLESLAPSGPLECAGVGAAARGNVSFGGRVSATNDLGPKKAANRDENSIGNVKPAGLGLVSQGLAEQISRHEACPMLSPGARLEGNAEQIADSKVQCHADAHDLSVGKAVMIAGLQTNAFLNGQKGFLKEWDEKHERWKVQMENGLGKMLKPIHLKPLSLSETSAATAEAQDADTETHALSRQSKESKHVPPMETEKDGIEVASNALVRDGKDIQIGARVEIVGLVTFSEINGLAGIVKDWDGQHRRWKILMEDGSRKLIKPENLRVASAADKAASAEAEETGVATAESEVADSGKYDVHQQSEENNHVLSTEEGQIVTAGNTLVGDGKGIQTGARVQIVGLATCGGYNGLLGIVKGWDGQHQRWKINMQDGSGKLIKTANLQVASAADTAAPAVAEEPGEIFTPINLKPLSPSEACAATTGTEGADNGEHNFHQQSGENTYVLPQEGQIETASNALVGDGKGIQIGARVQIVGLVASDGMNGLSGIVEGWDGQHQGWKVIMEDGSGPLVKPANLQLASAAAESAEPGEISKPINLEQLGLSERGAAMAEAGTAGIGVHAVHHLSEESKKVLPMEKGPIDTIGNASDGDNIEMQTGPRVHIDGLVTASGTNGLSGSVDGSDGKNQRWKIDTEGGSRELIKPGSFEVADGGDTATPAETYHPGAAGSAMQHTAGLDSLPNSVGATNVTPARESHKDTIKGGSRDIIKLERLQAANGGGTATLAETEEQHVSTAVCRGLHDYETVQAASPLGAAGNAMQHIAGLDSLPTAVGATDVTPARKFHEDTIKGGVGFRPGQRVVGRGLQTATELNGKGGTIVEFDPSVQRWKVQMDDGTGKLLKPSNLQIINPHLLPGVRVAISGISERIWLNGQQGTLIQFDVDTRRWQVLMDDNSGKLLKPENLEPVNGDKHSAVVKTAGTPAREDAPLAPGTRVAMRGLQGRVDLNGVEGIVEKIIKQDGEEWAKLRMVNGGRKRVRARKLIAVPGNVACPGKDQAREAVMAEGAMAADARPLQPEVGISVPATQALLQQELESHESAKSRAVKVELPQKVLIAMLVENVDYVKLRSRADLVHGFVEEVQEAIAAEGGSCIEPKHVTATLSEGSPQPLDKSRSRMTVHVDVVVEPPEGITAKAVQESLAASRSICERTAANIKKVPHIAIALKAEISISILSLASSADLTIKRQQACEILMQASTTGELSAVLQQIQMSRTSAPPGNFVNTPPRSTLTAMPTPEKVQQPNAHPEIFSGTTPPLTPTVISKELELAVVAEKRRQQEDVTSRHRPPLLPPRKASTSTEPMGAIAAAAGCGGREEETDIKERASSPARPIPWAGKLPPPKAEPTPCSLAAQSVVVPCVVESPHPQRKSLTESSRIDAASSESCDRHLILSAGEPQFTAGTRVRLKDLSKFSEMNGQCGTVVGWDSEKLRWKIRLDNVQSGKSSGKLFSPANLDVHELLPSKAGVPSAFVESRVSEEASNFEIRKDNIDRVAEDNCKGFDCIREALRTFFSKVVQIQRPVKSDLAPFDLVIRRHVEERKENCAQVDEVERIHIKIVAEWRQGDLWNVTQNMRCSLLTSNSILKAG